MRLSPVRLVVWAAALCLGATLLWGLSADVASPDRSETPRALFSEREVKVLPTFPESPGWSWGISLIRFGAPDDPHAPGPAAVMGGGDRVEYLRGDLLESYRNGPRGIEHALDLQGRGEPALVRFEFALSGNLSPKVSEDGLRVLFLDMSGKPVLAYLDLRGQDAEGREVAARWGWIEHAEENHPVLRLELQGPGRAFPLRVSGRIANPGLEVPSAAPARPETGSSTLTAPANDLCTGAEVVSGAGPFPALSSIVKVTDATTLGDPPVPTCQADVSRSVWFAFTPTLSAPYSFSVCSDAPTATTVEDTVLALYASTGFCAGLAETAGGCSDDSCGPTTLQSSIQGIALTAGTTYYIVVWIYGTAPPPPGADTVQLRVDRAPPPAPAPANDLCEGAETIPGSGPFPYLSSITSDISGATTAGDPKPPSCQPNVSRSIWYSFTPAESARYSFSLCANAPTGSTVNDTVLAIYTAAADCSGFLEVPGGCDDDSCTAQAAQSTLAGIGLTAGTRYYLVVWEYGPAAPASGHTSIQMRVSRSVGPSNDLCAAAIDLPLDTPLSGSTVGSFDDTRLPAGSLCFAGIGQMPSVAGGGDVAYRFTAPGAGRYSFRVSGYDVAKNVVLYASTDCPSGGAPATVSGCLGAANRTSVFPEEVSCMPLAAGQTVTVYVDEDALTGGSPFTLEANHCPEESEPNDTPDSAEEPACGTTGAIAPAGDADFFTLGIPETGSRVFAMVDGVAAASTDFDLRLTSRVDTLEYDDFNNDVPFGSASPNISGARLSGTEAFLRISHYSAAAQAEPYRLYASIQPPASRATPEIEPDDTIATATFGANEYYAGALSGPADVDLFGFSAVAGELIVIGLDLDPLRDNTPFNGSLALLDAAGTTLALVNDPAFASSNLPGTGSLTATTPTAPGEAMTYRVRGTGVYTVRVAWSSGTPGDYLLSIAHNCRVRPATDISVSQSDTPDPVAPGGSVTYSIVVRNLGGEPASNVTLRDDLPAGAVFVSASADQGECAGSGPVVCHLGTLQAGASVAVRVTVSAPAVAARMANAARITTAVVDSSPENDSSSEETTVAADADGDGIPDIADCAPSDPMAWAVPGEAGGLDFPFPADTTRLQWSAPAAPGGAVVLYDLLRSTSPGNFLTPTCLVANSTATSATDADLPGAIFYYLVRSENVCGGNLGTRSDGTPRTGGACP